MAPFKYEVLQKPWFVLKEDFWVDFTLREVYQKYAGLDRMVELTGIHPDKKLYVIAPKGFVTDLASIPKPLQPFLKPNGLWGPAAAIHDLLYQKKPTTAHYALTDAGNLSRSCDKHFADLMFLYIMRRVGVCDTIRNDFYLAVTNFGWDAYHDDNSWVKYPSPNDLVIYNCRNYEFFREHIEPAVPKGDRWSVTEKCYGDVAYNNVKRHFLTIK